MSQKIIGLKLVSGVDVLGKFKDENGSLIELDDAVFVNIMPTQQGQMAVSMVPPTLLSNNDDNLHGMLMTVHRSSILVQYTPNAQVEKMYLEHTSRIAIAGAGDLAGLKK